MKRAALTLAVLAVLGLAASTAFAAPPPTGYMTTGLVAHHGHPGYPWGYHSPVIIHPPIPHHSAIVYPAPVYRSMIRRPIRRVYGYPYRPHRGFSYQGNGFGFSIGF